MMASYFMGIFFLKSFSDNVESTRKKIRPPSSAGMGSRFITARFMAIMAPK